MFVTMCRVCRRLVENAGPTLHLVDIIHCCHKVCWQSGLYCWLILSKVVGSILATVIFYLLIISNCTLISIISEQFWSEFGYPKVGIYSEFTWTRILPIPSRSEWNGQNLVGMEIKSGWDFTQIPFLPNSYHSNQIPLGSTRNAWLRVKYSHLPIFLFVFVKYIYFFASKLVFPSFFSFFFQLHEERQLQDPRSE